MDEALKDILTKYRDCTLKIIETIQNDNLDSLEKLIEERKNLVEETLNTNDEKEKMKQIYEELRLNELGDELNSLMARKISLIRNEMEKIDKSKVANNLYNKGKYVNAKIFSKKI